MRRSPPPDRRTEIARTGPPRRRTRVKPMSDRRRRLLPARRAVTAAARSRDGERCVGPERGLPGECWGRLDPHEVVPCGRDSTSWLDVDRIATLCRGHHEYVTDAYGEALELVERVGLLLHAGPVAQPTYLRRPAS